VRLLRMLVAMLIALPLWAPIAPMTPAAADIVTELRWWRPKKPKKPKKPPRTRGVPGPVVGVGLPMLVIVGAGAFWLVRRRRNGELSVMQSHAASVIQNPCSK
jgi:hypothetical protein